MVATTSFHAEKSRRIASKHKASAGASAAPLIRYVAA